MAPHFRAILHFFDRKNALLGLNYGKSCTCFMNNGESPVLVFEQRGSDRDIVHGDYYQPLIEEAKR